MATVHLRLSKRHSTTRNDFNGEQRNWLAAAGLILLLALYLYLHFMTPTVALPPPAQTAWHALLRAQGYRVEVVRSLPAFIELLTDYLS